jgi:hypothetical protein
LLQTDLLSGLNCPNATAGLYWRVSYRQSLRNDSVVAATNLLRVNSGLGTTGRAMTLPALKKFYCLVPSRFFSFSALMTFCT